MQQAADFFLRLEYVKSELNMADAYTRQSPGLEASISQTAFQKIVNRMGPFQWDLMASSANVNKGMDGKPLKFLQAQKLTCVVLVPQMCASWCILLHANTVSSFVVAEPYDNKTFSISSADGRIVPKVYNHATIAVFVKFN